MMRVEASFPIVYFGFEYRLVADIPEDQLLVERHVRDWLDQAQRAIVKAGLYMPYMDIPPPILVSDAESSTVGELDDAALIREFISRLPNILKRLAES